MKDFDVIKKSLILLCLFCGTELFGQEMPRLSMGGLYGPEAYAAGFKLKVQSSAKGLYYGGYAIAGLVPVSGAVGALAGYDWGFGELEVDTTWTGWATERVGINASVGYFSLNPKVGLYVPFSIFNPSFMQELHFLVGPSFFYPKSWDNDGINVLFQGTLWNFEVLFSFVPEPAKATGK